MRLRSTCTVLLFISLLDVGCSKPTTTPPESSSTTPTKSSAQSELNVSSPAQTQDGFPLLTPIMRTGTLAPSNSNQFTFVVFGDNQRDTHAPTILSRIFGTFTQSPKPLFALSLGDIIKGEPCAQTFDEQYIKTAYADYVSLAATANIPIFNAPGNHEMDELIGDCSRHREKPTQRMHDAYSANAGAPLYGAFDYGNSRFIVLNTEDVPSDTTPPPPKGYEFSYMSDVQLKQLDADLAANAKKTHIFITMHYPIHPDPNEGGGQTASLNPSILARLTGILGKYSNVSYIFASHQHIFYDYQPNKTNPFKAGEPTRYLVSGGAGARGGDYHYLLVEVNGDTVSVTMKPI